jgi:predicted O-methyltransferase YrrM
MTVDLITDDVGEELEAHAMWVPEDQAIVEIGSYRGGSTTRLVRGARDETAIYAVDPWEQVDVKTWCRHCEPVTRAEFEERMGLAVETGRVRILQGRSTDVAKTYDGPPIGLLFIDGDHSYAAAWGDLVAWKMHLAPKAIVAVDDYGVTRNPGVSRAVDEVVATGLYELRDVVAGGRVAILRVF